MRRRVLASMVGLVGVVLVSHDVPLALYLSDLERDRLTTAIERDAFTVGGRISPVIGLDEPDRTGAVNDVLDGFRLYTGSTVIVTDEAGYLVASTNPTDVPGEDYVGRPEIAAALLGTAASGERSSVTMSEDLLYVAVPVFSGPDVVGVVRISYPRSVLDERVDRQLRSLLLAGSVSVGTAIAVALILSRYLARPLESLRRVTDEVAAGDLTVEAPEQGPPEIRRLASSFNSMTRRLGGLLDRQRRFAGDASHQLRTPLTALRLRLEQAADQLDSDPATAREHVEAALDETSRLSHLVEQLLRLARAEGAVLEVGPVDVTALVRGRVDEWQALAEERGVGISTVATAPQQVTTSELALREIIDNYIDNALEVSPTGSTVEVLVSTVEGGVEIVVRDSGPGMSDDNRVNAFGRYWQGDTVPSRRSASGLGLAIVAQLAASSGLKVELRRSPSGGIDAVVTAPLRPEP